MHRRISAYTSGVKGHWHKNVNNFKVKLYQKGSQRLSVLTGLLHAVHCAGSHCHSSFSSLLIMFKTFKNTISH